MAGQTLGTYCVPTQVSEGHMVPIDSCAHSSESCRAASGSTQPSISSYRGRFLKQAGLRGHVSQGPSQPTVREDHLYCSEHEWVVARHDEADAMRQANRA